MLAPCPRCPLPAAGALALLQEAGESAAVAEVGQAWLAAHRRERAAADVALAAALALCDGARAALEPGQQDGGVVQASRKSAGWRTSRE